MKQDGPFSDFSEVWISAKRMRTLFLTSLLTSVMAALADGWKRLRARTASQRARPRTALKPNEDAALVRGGTRT